MNRLQQFVCWMGFHNGHGGLIESDGASLHGTCSRCGRQVMRDSQGNWFR